MNVKELFVLVPFVLTLHELEEWNMHGHHETAFAPGECIATKLSERLWLVFLSLAGFLGTAM